MAFILLIQINRLTLGNHQAKSRNDAMQKSRYTLNGFTLIELVIVIIIIGILAAIVAPKLIGISSEAKAANIKSLTALMYDTATQYSYKNQLNQCQTNHNEFNDVSLTYGQIYSGDWDIQYNQQTCNYKVLPLNGIPEIIEATGIDISQMWLVHTRNNPAPLSDNLWIVPYPPENKLGFHQVAHSNPATDASVLEATHCYIRYQTPRNTNNVNFQISFDTSGC